MHKPPEAVAFNWRYCQGVEWQDTLVVVPHSERHCRILKRSNRAANTYQGLNAKGKPTCPLSSLTRIPCTESVDGTQVSLRPVTSLARHRRPQASV